MQTMTTPGAMLKAMREKPPLVQCITNYVAMNVAANVLLAAGASPAMVHAAEEAGEFAGIANALTINIGTLSTQWIDGMRAAAKAATSAGKPWVLDPVAHYATAFRRDAVASLLALKPSIIRGNASEIIALAGGESRGQGVDSRDPVEQAEGSARWLAERQQAVVAVTGPVDFVTDGAQAVRITGGSALMPQVTALGCSLTCLVGAFAATAPNNLFGATVAALATFAIAGEEAALGAAGPGSFAWRFLDALHALDAETLDARARISAA
ncbi:hydroxyethylthiazole kinase [Rhizobium hidalgonense]|uniref:Hydroxyethylthiazole kinase n=1 Tax=Rhizobium hidalgonense TaxID=1538159 RepID=A0A2A6K8B5_9HYPH|nr:hydroxyethylthiazole kinase [Rhizobium hidalgonense]MDR9776666.1 hydroxyethylthiazole kinase [Rhizobium hidalgonense]MDR9815049.1 hydroxyethylthiazole kinase [Rhizobium hidalgonense]MDR9823202.1 hydroxyethylthiazole kinase [Rhizobium hidalgonense]PDT20780.1 hydroxyethylthiazole kinase [Rhizobium hidalgonense]PON07013.1 hydroxyethylthiazole kinase [Rhizobium hidalgonense]